MRDTAFARYIGIDYSGAETPTASLKGLRVYMAEQDAKPVEIPDSLVDRKILAPVILVLQIDDALTRIDLAEDIGP